MKALDNNMCFHAFWLTQMPYAIVFKIALLNRSSEGLIINITFLLRVYVCTLKYYGSQNVQRYEFW